MSGRLRGMFDGLKGSRAALIPYATGYFPDRGRSVSVVLEMLEAGADAVEIGIPFSDPVMDGPVIQKTSGIALASGATPMGVLDLVSEVRGSTDKPLLVMSYYNTVFRRGLMEFARDARSSGVDGVVIPDLPAEEMIPWKRECDREGLSTVAFCSATTGDSRIRLASSLSSGFLYCVSLLGTTGPREVLSRELPELIERARRNADCPLVIGVGISTPEQCAEAGGMADGVIVGSALMKILLEGGEEDDLGAMVRELRRSIVPPARSGMAGKEEPGVTGSSSG